MEYYPKTVCKNLVAEFDKKIAKIKDNGERTNIKNKEKEDKENKKKKKWKNNRNMKDLKERIIYNEEVLEKMQKKIRKLKIEIKLINDHIKNIIKQNIV